MADITSSMADREVTNEDESISQDRGLFLLPCALLLSRLTTSYEIEPRPPNTGKFFSRHKNTKNREINIGVDFCRNPQLHFGNNG
jgi:hypothetical protein